MCRRGGRQGQTASANMALRSRKLRVQYSASRPAASPSLPVAGALARGRPCELAPVQMLQMNADRLVQPTPRRWPAKRLGTADAAHAHRPSEPNQRDSWTAICAGCTAASPMAMRPAMRRARAVSSRCVGPSSPAWVGAPPGAQCRGESSPQMPPIAQSQTMVDAANKTAKPRSAAAVALLH